MLEATPAWRVSTLDDGKSDQPSVHLQVELPGEFVPPPPPPPPLMALTLVRPCSHPLLPLSSQTGVAESSEITFVIADPRHLVVHVPGRYRAVRCLGDGRCCRCVAAVLLLSMGSAVQTSAQQVRALWTTSQSPDALSHTPPPPLAGHHPRCAC